jgi:hypothetical protein
MSKPEDPNIPWSEANIQMYVATHSLRDGYLFHADSLGANKGRAGGNKMKLQGACAGWPDLVYILNGRTVYIELKAIKGSVSAVQEALHEKMRAMGCEVWVVKALDGPTAWREIKAILEAK